MAEPPVIPVHFTRHPGSRGVGRGYPGSRAAGVAGDPGSRCKHRVRDDGWMGGVTTGVDG